MNTLTIKEHSLASWTSYADQFGFTPDPMILRAGEVFLNGRAGSLGLGRADFEVWRALKENIGGIVDFFDILVRRDAIPLINYGDSFDRMSMEVPLDKLLGERIRNVEIDHLVYNTIKKGALLDLATMDIARLKPFAHVLSELQAFRYDWKPRLDVPGADPALDAARVKFGRIDSQTLPLAQFLLGGLIFSGFAKASTTMHYIQPKRARLYLGLTAAPDAAGTLSNNEETAIFDAAQRQLEGSKVQAWRGEVVPPVLPYLLGQGPEPKSVRELLDRALAFRDSSEGKRYRNAVDTLQADGIKARQVEDAAIVEHRRAIEFLRPYSKLDPEKSRSLEITVSSELVGIPGADASFKLGIPAWLRVWWNDNVPFGGVRKTLRRMWMAAESYNDLSAKLEKVWARS